MSWCPFGLYCKHVILGIILLVSLVFLDFLHHSIKNKKRVVKNFSYLLGLLDMCFA